MNEDETDKTSNLMEDLPRLDRKQKLLLQKSWTKLHSKMDTVGVVTFLHLFETHPKTLKPFLHHINSAKEMEMDEWYQEKLRDHALRVMAVVEKTMHRLDREEKAAQVRFYQSFNERRSECALMTPFPRSMSASAYKTWRAQTHISAHFLRSKIWLCHIYQQKRHCFKDLLLLSTKIA